MMKSTYLWGLLAGVFIVIETIIGIEMGMFSTQTTYKNYFMLVSILTLGAGIYLGLSDYKTKNNSFISFGRCMFNGMLISALAGMVLAIGVTLYYEVKPGEKQKLIDDSAQFLLHEKDSTASTLEEYKQHLVKGYTDTVKVTSADMPKIQQMAQDSANAVQQRIDRAADTFKLSTQLIGNIGSNVLIGLLVSLIIAAVMASKTQQPEPAQTNSSNKKRS